MSNFPPLDGSAPKKQKFDAAPEMGIDPSKRYTATMETSMGTLVIALDPIAAPITVNNFVFLAAQHYYDGIIFHRIIAQPGNETASPTPMVCTELQPNVAAAMSKTMRNRVALIAPLAVIGLAERHGETGPSVIGAFHVVCVPFVEPPLGAAQPACSGVFSTAFANALSFKRGFAMNKY